MSSRLALFATRVGIKNFRGYGPEFELKLPARPCVVLLSGPNGLGKTSLFEAVEWALTGAVKRLDQLCGASADPHDMVRRAPDVDRFEVELDFSDAGDEEPRVRRVQMAPASGATPASVGTAVSSIAEFLRSGDPRWSVTEQNVADYLHLTHLHAQVASLRFVTFDAKKRWVHVSPLAGADRFERVRLNLINSKGPITRLAKDRAQDVAKATERRQHWQNKLDRCAEMKVLEAAVRDALGPSEVLAELDRTRQALALRPASEVIGDEPDVTRAGQAIRTLRAELERAREERVSRSEVLGRLRAIPRQWAQNRQQIALLAPRISALEEDRASERRQLEQRVAQAQERATAQEAALRERDRSTKRHERLLAALRDREDVERLAPELADADAQLQVAEKAREAAEVELRKLREDLASREQVMTARDDARKRTEAVGQALRGLSESETLRRQLVVEEARSATAAASLRALSETSAALAEAIQEKRRLVEQAEQLLESQRKSAASLQLALLAIAEHLTDEDTTCPVCRTAFGHGDLRALARQAIENLDPTLATGEAAVASAREELEDLRRRERQLAQDRRKAEADEKTVNATVAELNRRIQALRSHPLVGDAPAQETLDRLTRLEAESKADLQRLERTLANSRSAEELRQLVVEGAGAVEDKKRTYALAHERRKAREARLAEVRARMEQIANDEPGVAATGQALGLAAQGAAHDAAKAKANAEEAAAAVDETKAAETASRLKLRALEEELSNVQAEQTAYVTAVTSFEGQWTAAGLEQPIAEGALDSEVNATAQAGRSLESALAALTGLSASLERWRQAANLQALEEEIRAEHGDLDMETYTRGLDDAVAAAQADLAKAERARIAADELSDTFKRVTSGFGDRALKPFGDLFQRYLRALVHDERFHGIEVNYQAAARAAGLRFLVGLGGATSADTEAEYILSEGQLGEVSLAAMLAASTAFPWSRWKALLMDDPTQYNDLIHATALFDVLRNLVRSEGYQVFVSTHDSEQASFLRRKLDGVGIDWVDCRYLGHGANGILVELTQRLTA